MSLSGEEQDPVARILASVRHCVTRGDWDTARQHALDAAALAEAKSDPVAMMGAGDYLERFNEFGTAGRLLAKGARLAAGVTDREWDGTELRDGTLLIEQRIRDIGAPIRQARLIPLAAERVGRCIVSIDPRLVDLFSRSFPSVEVRPQGASDAALRSKVDVFASFETLLQHLAPDAAAMEAKFTPLRADPGLVASLRERYREGASNFPLIGLSWASTNRAKDIPSIECWAAFLRPIQARFVSLQYGDIATDVARFASSGVTIAVDPAVDSLRDFDAFAAQINSLDAVVTISNTTAHMAGALGIPTVVVLDDTFHLIWPVAAQKTPWYPQTMLVRKRGREWPETLREITERFPGLLSSRLPS